MLTKAAGPSFQYRNNSIPMLPLHNIADYNTERIDNTSNTIEFINS